MSKLREDLRVGIMGAAAGLFAISVALMIARIDAYYAYKTWLYETSYSSYNGGVENLWWIPVTIWHLILSTTASLLVHRYLTTRLRSTFLLWQVVGFACLLGWGLTFLLLVAMEGVMTGNLEAVQRTFTSGEIVDIAKYVSVGFACNVFYGSVMKASSRHYTEQLDGSSNVDHLLAS